MFEEMSAAEVPSAALDVDPGPAVLAALAELDVRQLDPAARVDLLVALERQAAWLAALTQPVMAAIGHHAESVAARERAPGESADVGLRAAHAEIEAALRLSESIAGMRLVTARALCGPLGAVLEALSAGTISIWHANAIVDSTVQLSDEKAAAVADKVLPKAGGQTVAQLRRCLRKAVIAADPQAAADRAEKAKADRCLDWWATSDGMATLRLNAPVTDVMAVYAAADELARRLAKGHPVGSPGWQPIAARRADALVVLAAGVLAAGDLRPGRSGADLPANMAELVEQVRSRLRVDVQVTMDLPTALGLADNPAELAGYGPLPAPLARALAVDGKWRRLSYEPQSGALLDLGRSRYTPSAELARLIRARDMTCNWPGCNRPAHRCEIDHGQPFRPHEDDGGRTDRVNLGPFCGYHHDVKHRAGWLLRRDPQTGQATWISPTGHRYANPAHDYRPTLADPGPAGDRPWDEDDEYRLRAALTERIDDSPLDDDPLDDDPLDYDPTRDGNWFHPADPAELSDAHIPLDLSAELAADWAVTAAETAA